MEVVRVFQAFNWLISIHDLRYKKNVVTTLMCKSEIATFNLILHDFL